MVIEHLEESLHEIHIKKNRTLFQNPIAHQKKKGFLGVPASFQNAVTNKTKPIPNSPRDSYSITNISTNWLL